MPAYAHDRDPITHVKDMLQTQGVKEDEIKAIDKEIKEIVNAAAQFAQENPEPDEAELWTDVLVETE